MESEGFGRISFPPEPRKHPFLALARLKRKIVKDQLYLLRPGFKNSGVGPLYCGDSVPVEGLLSFFPALRSLVDVHYLEFLRPRAVLVEALGEEHQGVPVLILASDRKLNDASPKPSTVKGKRYFSDERAIRQYLSTQYDLPQAG